MAEGGFGGFHGGLDFGDSFQGGLFFDGKGDEFGGVFFHAVGEFGEGLAGLFDDGEDDEGADDAVAGGGEIGEDEVAGVFAAEVVAAFAHALEDVSVADLGLFEGDAIGGEGVAQAEVAHDGGDEGVAAELALFFKGFGAEAEDAVAADNLAIAIDEDDAVGVAIETDTDVGFVFFDEFGGFFRVEGADAFVDVVAIGRGAEFDDFGAEFFENERADEVAGTVSAIDNDFETFEIFVADGRFGKLDVSTGGVIDAEGFSEADVGRSGLIAAEDDFFDGFLEGVVEFVAVWAEDFDAVVGEGIVGGGEHDAGVAGHGLGQMSDGGSGDGAGEEDAGAFANEATREGGLEHVTADAGVFSDDDFMTAFVLSAKDAGDSSADTEGDFGCNGVFIGNAADTIGSK